MAKSTDLIRALKSVLKSRHLTYAEVAQHLGLSRASVKRLFANEDFSLSRLDAICELVGMQLGELVRMSEGPAEPLTQLTVAQEQALVSDARLLLVTYLALNQWPIEQILANFRIDRHELTRALARLDKLGIIDLLPGDRIRLKTARNFRWRQGGPIQQFFEAQVREEFFASDFGGPNDDLHFVGGLLSERSLAVFRRSLEKLAHEFDELARADAGLPLDQRWSCAAVLACRRWEFTLFEGFKRTPGESPTRG